METAANVTCTKRHDLTATLRLKKDGNVIASQTASFTNAFGMGTRTLIVSSGIPPRTCGWFQGQLTLTISGLGTTSVTSGSPDSICH